MTNLCIYLYSAKKLGYLSLGVLLLLIGEFSLITAQTTAETNLPENNNTYKIGIGDVLKIVVIKQDLLSVDGVRVNNNGTIRIPMVDSDVPAACLTEGELSASIIGKYKKYLLNPQVYVIVREYNSNSVAVVGAVNSPGRFQLTRPIRLLELLTYVNGPSLNAGYNVQIVRTPNSKKCGQNSSELIETAKTDESQQEIISLPLADVIKGTESYNPLVQVGDIIRVTEAEQAYIIGNVKTAITVNLKEPVTLSKAIAMAGGFVADAQLDKIKITRQIPNSLAKTEIIVNLKNNNKINQEDIILQANDIVDVPGPTGKRKFLKDIFRAIIPAVTRVPLIIP